LTLLTAIVTAVRATASKSPIPALEGLLIETVGEAIRLTGYDLKTGIVATVPATVEETGGIVLNARLFGEIIRRMPDSLVSVSVGSGYQTKIDSGASTFDIIGSPSADYPELPSVDGQSSVVIDERTLKSMITQTIFAVSDNESRPVYTGAMFEIEGEDVTIIAVDGYRLALRRESAQVPARASHSFIVPGAALSEVEKIITGEGDTVFITVGTKHVMFTIGDTVVVSRRLEGEFINHRNAIPAQNKYAIHGARREIVDAVERVSLIISDRAKSPIRCLFTDNLLYLSATSPFGRANDECAVNGDGEKLEIGFNNRYLLDALKAASTDEIEIRMTSPVAPCVIAPIGDEPEKFLYMILPVRLSRAEGDLPQ
jgi:DNA polymerase-3 subunit beta